MSTPRRPHSPLPVRERAMCMCGHGGTCSSFAPGHALHLIQTRLAAATPSDWIDAVVEHADAARGDVALRSLAGERISVWNADGAAEQLAPGTPVALHGRYAVLAIGAQRYNVLRTA